MCLDGPWLVLRIITQQWDSSAGGAQLEAPGEARGFLWADSPRPCSHEKHKDGSCWEIQLLASFLLGLGITHWDT